jgi:Vanadium chloroperoxidase N-terminal domain/PAP2 superfamily
MDPILYWNEVALEANRVAHTEKDGKQTGPTLSSRALAIVHLAMHDAYFGVQPNGHALYLPGATGLPPGGNVDAAVAAAACATLVALHPSQTATFEAALGEAGIMDETAAESRAYGLAVANAILDKLAVKPGEPGADDAHYWPSLARGRHRKDPDDPGQPFHGPYYGTTARRIAVTTEHALDAPPALADGDYKAALEEVRAKGGAPGLPTTRTPEETAIGIYWAYDGASEIGTPPRLYNQIVRTIAEAKGNGPADNARLFALVNAAMGDAGIFSWKDKYGYDLWRPVLGIREHDPSTGPQAVGGNDLDPCADPFWLPLGAPRTNTDQKSFTPPFPAYPSGHATFGAAAFQMVRRFYACDPNLPDDIAFEFVSDELDGKSKDRDGTVRTRHKRQFASLWQAIFENGQSRVFLGVHWVFDAFAAADVKNPDGSYKDPASITYTQNVGGVPLGLAIANDIFDSGLVCPEPAAVASASAKPVVQLQRTSYSK